MDVVGPALVLDAPPSFWGGFDPATGTITEIRHPNCGARVTEQVLVIETTKGSSGGASMLAEAIRRGTGPAAVVLRRPSLAIAIGTLTPEVLYGTATPYAVVAAGIFDAIRTGDRLRVSSEGTVERLDG
jgi:predicted aconitase with swiveling domain